MRFGDFFWRVVGGGESGEFAGFFEGVGEKWVSKTWCFDGEFVVRCVADVVVRQHDFSI
jgi:hypothetical protein